MPQLSAFLAALLLTSPAFEASGAIPQRHTCNGADVSPTLRWTDPPTGTRSYVLIVDDPDAPRGTFTHWLLANIPQSVSALAEAFRPGSVGTSGRNDFGTTGYGGPCPPSGRHTYSFRLSALDVPSLPLEPGASKDDIERAMQGHVLATLN
jgi:Raf kinase inhibitor-like YbhB/YbcL family protein